MQLRVLAFVLAGGKGTRLYPLTKERAKPAVPFGGRYRIIDFVLSNLVNSGVYSTYVLIQFKSQSLLQHIRDGWEFSGLLKNQFVIPVPAQMRSPGETWYRGTADAVYQNINLIEQADPHLVCIFGADHIYRMNIREMIEFHEQKRAQATVAAIPVDKQYASEFGVIECGGDGRIHGFHEKNPDSPTIPGKPDQVFASMGNYIFSTGLLLRELYAQFGMHYVGNVFWQVEHIPSRKPLNGIADLKGLKIRVPPGLVSDMLSKAGAAVVNIAGGDVFTALQSGVIDAADWSSPSMNIDSGLHKVAKYSVNASHSLPACEIAVSKAKWDAIPPDLKKLFEAEVRAMSAKVKDTIIASDKAALEKLKADGVQVITWPKEEVNKLRAVTWEVQDQFAARSPMAKKIVESLRSFQKNTAR